MWLDSDERSCDAENLFVTRKQDRVSGTVSLDREQSAEQGSSPVFNACLSHRSFQKPFPVTAYWLIFHDSILGVRRAVSNHVGRVRVAL